VLRERRGAVGWIYLNRPASMNALGVETLVQLEQALDEFETAPALRVVVITGKGRAFCAGADLRSPAGKVDGGETLQNFLAAAAAMERTLAAMSKPVIAAVNGTCCGGGLELALACDFIIAAETAPIGSAHIKAGVIPCGGATARLTKLLGPGTAKYLLFTGTLLPAKTLLGTGLVQHITSEADLETDVERIAGDIAGQSPLAVRHLKRLVNGAVDSTLEAAMLAEREAAQEYGASHDAREGKRAFAERRKPNYQGR
jgi:enoyl-CoA hydratase/carnithine racemase